MIRAALVVGLFATALAQAQASSGRIAFYSDRDGNDEIYSINPDGSDLKRLTNHDADDQCPAKAGRSAVRADSIAFTTLRAATTAILPTRRPQRR